VQRKIIKSLQFKCARGKISECKRSGPGAIYGL